MNLQSLIRGVIVKVFQMLVSAPAGFTRELYEISEVAGHLLCCITLYKPEIYTQLRLSSEFRLKDLLISGLLSRGSAVTREFFQRVIYFLCENVRDLSVPLSQSPLFDLLGGMLDVKVFSSEQECGEACEVLLTSLETYKHIATFDSGKVKEMGELMDPIKKLGEVMNSIKGYQARESVDAPDTDKGLLGLLRLAEKLVSMQGYLAEVPAPLRNEAIDEVAFRCLFPLRKAIGDEAYSFKCKSQQSREAAFKLLESLVDFDETSMLSVLSDCLLSLPEHLDEPAVWDYTPEKAKRAACGYVGMRNLGCICYMNSMMQQLFMVPPFRSAMLSVKDNVLPSVDNPLRIDDNMLHQLQCIFGYLAFSTRQEFNPQRFCFAFKDSDNKPTNTSLQQDAHEFLNILFDRLERSLKPTPYARLVQSIFGGKICNQLVCSQCGTVKRNYEDMYTLSLEIKNQRNFHEAMDKFVANSPVSGYFCEACRNKVEVSKRTLLAGLPNILIVHLQRFTYNYDLGVNEKIHTKFEFPNTLNMLQYTEEGAASSGKQHAAEKKGGSEDEKETAFVTESDSSREESHEEGYYAYKLVGVVVHNGNAEGGHYYSYINTNRGENEGAEGYLNTESDPWLEFNDTVVKEFDFKRVPTECFGGAVEEYGPSLMQDIGDAAGANRSRSAYMLFYERKAKSQIPESSHGAESRAPVVMHDFHRLPMNVVEEIKTVCVPLSVTARDNSKWSRTMRSSCMRSWCSRGASARISGPSSPR